MKKKIEFSLVIPCLNEDKTLPLVIRKCQRTIQRLKLSAEIVISDNGSSDASVQIAQSMGVRIIHCPQKGYGNAVIFGLKKACGTYYIIGDADDSYNFEEIDGFVAGLRAGYDVVMGTRLKGRIKKGAMPWMHRYIGTPLLTGLINYFFHSNISDSNCGLRGLSKKAFRAMALSAPGMEFASEIPIKVGIMKLRATEIPVTLYQDKRTRSSHLHTWSDGWRNICLIWKFLFQKKDI